MEGRDGFPSRPAGVTPDTLPLPVNERCSIRNAGDGHERIGVVGCSDIHPT